MQIVRISMFVILASLTLSGTSYAYCVTCLVNECWARYDARNFRCYSSGTACLLAGPGCTSADSGLCGVGDAPPCEDGFAALRPLHRDYVLTAVRVEMPRPARMTFAQKENR